MGFAPGAYAATHAALPSLACSDGISDEFLTPYIPAVAVQALFIQGGIQMIVSEVVVAILLAVQFNSHSGEAISPPIGVAVIVFICLFVAGFGWSWGPLGWLVPNEIQPLETRSAGQVNVPLCTHLCVCPPLCDRIWAVLGTARLAGGDGGSGVCVCEEKSPWELGSAWLASAERQSATDPGAVRSEFA